MNEIKYLFKKTPDFKITNLLYIKHHTYKEIIKYGEEKYINNLYLLLTTAHDYKSYMYKELDMYWTDIDDFTFFCMMINRPELFEDNFVFTKPLSDYKLYKNTETDDYLLIDPYTEDIITKKDVEVIKEHINSMLGYTYKDHKEFPANEETKKLIIEKDSKNLKSTTPYTVSIKDIIISSLYHEFDNVENHQFDKYNDKDKYGYDLGKGYDAAYNIGRNDTIKILAEKIIEELNK